MSSSREFRAIVATIVASAIAGSPAHALVSLNDGHDKINVSAGVSVGHDSNVFANRDSRGDFVYSTSVTADYARRAGWIGVNAFASVVSSRFGTIKGQDFDNPNFGLEFTKQTGRTTGSLSLGAARESRADAAVNLRSTSWNVPVGLTFKYPITGANTLAGTIGYASRRYLDETTFTSLETYNASVDLLHMLSSERDMIAGYRYRFSDTSRDTTSSDHGLSVGLNGKLIRGVHGNLRVGYQTRIVHGLPGGTVNFDSWTASGSTTYAFSKRLQVNGTLAKDFSTTATDASVDSMTATLEAQYLYSARWSLDASFTFGDVDFLGDAGRILIAAGPPPTWGDPRHDNYFNWHVGLNYTLNDHLRASLAYVWFQNWSGDSIADFTRTSWTMNLSTHW
jgi:hypothetical protein